jgi:carbonic anhydrase/acetyltransferase-like protein (isoleucine patch superfamily)
LRFVVIVNSISFAVQPSTQVVKLGKSIPVIDGAFIAPSATIAGRVNIARGASVWYGAVVRGTAPAMTGFVKLIFG